MERKDIYRLINEEISEFDFLGIDRVQKDIDLNELLMSREFQVKLIKDICEKDQTLMSDIDVTYREEDKWDDENSKFDFYIEFNFDYLGNRIPIYITIEGDLKFPEDSSITFFSLDGKKVDFSWIDKNEGLKKKFVECLVSEYSM